MLSACYSHAMGNLQIKNLPDDVHEELRRRAAEQGLSLRDYVVRLIRRDLAMPSAKEWLAAVDERPRTKLARPVADYIREDREEREAHLARIFDERRS
jgi:plasmid stability protein